MGGRFSGQSSTPKNPYSGRNSVQPTTTPTALPEKQTVPGESRDDREEFYDGIPRYQRSLYQKSRSLRASTVSEVSSRLSRVGSTGLVKVTELLDTLGINVGGFVLRPTTKNSELSILAFEVANTLVKGSNLMGSLSKRSLRRLKELVLLEEGVQRLVSNDMDELLKIVSSDIREELKVFSREVVRFGNRCRDPQWHNLDRFFEKCSRDRTSQNQLRARAESVMLQLMASVQLTVELYKELHALDKFEQEYGLTRANMFTEWKSQQKFIKNLKKKSLWSMSMEEVVEKLVDIVLFLNREINYTFGNPESETLTEEGIIGDQRRLGPAGLALHYANIILQIDSIVTRLGYVPAKLRATLYSSLPPNVRDSLRTKLRSFSVDKELSVSEIQYEMEKTLCWLVPVATNTARAHHGFGWVGEWASTGSELSRASTVGSIEAMRIETLHHADKNKTEEYILHLLLWLNCLVSRFSKASADRGRVTANKERQRRIEETGNAGLP